LVGGSNPLDDSQRQGENLMDASFLKQAYREWVQSKRKDKRAAFGKVYKEFLKLGVKAFSQPPNRKKFNDYGICHFADVIFMKISNKSSIANNYRDRIINQIMNALFPRKNINYFLFCNRLNQKGYID
jgi:hypothetical protein